VRYLILFGALALLTGCADDKPMDVAGAVTYGGDPLPAGVVWFDPDPGHPAKPPQGFAYVKDGKFNSADQGRGVRPGAYTVRVEGFDGKPGNELPMGKPLFAGHEFRKEFAKGEGELVIAVPGKKK
jgi:hypothetical protein